MRKRKANKWLNKTAGQNLASTGLPTSQHIQQENATIPDLSLLKLSISDITVADFIALLPTPPQDLMYEFLDAIELDQNAPQRERAAQIEAMNMRINRLKLLANAYNTLHHEGILSELNKDGVTDPANVDNELRSDEVELKRLKQQYDEENKGGSIDKEWFEEVLRAASDYKKYNIDDNIKLSRFCMYYKELNKVTAHGGQ